MSAGALFRLDVAASARARPTAVLTDTRRGVTWRVALSRSRGAWSAELRAPMEPTVLRYHFALADGRRIRERRQIEGVNEAIYGRWETRDFQLAVYAARSRPEWAADQIAYQIFPDRFARGRRAPLSVERTVYGRPARALAWGAPPEVPPKGRDFFGGDLAGIRERLGYLADLGVTCLYFTPVFASPTNHRYDALDYERIDPLLGDGRELRALVRDARRKGIRVVLDGVLNHCSCDSEYFRAAQRDREAPSYRWFSFGRWPDRYVRWAKVRSMPQFAETPEVEEFFFGEQGVIRRWARIGIAGWRLDVVPWKSREFWRRFAAAMRRERPDTYLIAEDWSDATDRLVGDTFDATMNYRFAYAVRGFATGRLSPSELDDRLETLRRDTPAPAFSTQLNLLTSHDTARLLTICDGDRARVKLATALQLAYPGTPMVYYGEEAGLEGRFAEDGRRAFPWDDPDRDLQRFFRTAMRARRRSAVLRRGALRTLLVDDRRSLYGLLREHRRGAVLALFNGGERAARVSLRLTGDDRRSGAWRDLLGGTGATARDGRLSVTLPPMSAAWLVRPR